MTIVTIIITTVTIILLLLLLSLLLRFRVQAVRGTGHYDALPLSKVIILM